MKVWNKGDGFQFENSKECFGESFDVKDAPLNMSVINIDGRYPNKGFAYNEDAHEMAYVVSGSGEVVLESGESEQIEVGSVVYLKNMEKFAWRGKMVLIMPCSPSFESEKHKETK